MGQNLYTQKEDTVNQKAGFISLLGSAMIFSLLGIAIRFFSGYFGNASQAAMRNIAALGVLVLIMALRSETFKVSWKETNKLAFLIYCVSGALATFFFIISAMQIKVASTVFYLYVASFVSAFAIGPWLFKEKLNAQKIVAVLIALVGLAIFSHPITTALSWGVVFGLLTGVGDTLHFTSQKFLTHIPRHTLLFYNFVVGVIILTAVAWISGEQMLQGIDASLLLAIPIFGIIVLALGETLLYGFNNFPLNMGTIVVSGELFFAMIINAIVLKEIPTATEVVGAVLIFMSIVVINLNLNGKTK